MNIYNFFKSPDIVDHCEKIGHDFNSLEMAVIIDISSRTLKDKFSAWREIIVEYPDMPIPASNGFSTARDSLHDYLNEYIAYAEDRMSLFLSASQDELYRCFSSRKLGFYDNEDGEISSAAYTTIEQAMEKLPQQSAWEEGYRVRIEKWKLNEENCLLSAEVDSNHELLDIYCNIHGLDYMEPLSEICIYIPTPFEIGDILIDGTAKPFVLTGMLYCHELWEKLSPEAYCGWDMQADGYFFHKNKFEWDHGFRIYELRYFTGELQGANRFLGYLSKFIKADPKCYHCLIGVYERYRMEWQHEENLKDRSLPHTKSQFKSKKPSPMTFRIKTSAILAIDDWFGLGNVIISDIAGEDDEMIVEIRASEKEILDWALHYGEDVDIISPSELRDKVREAAYAVWKKYE